MDININKNFATKCNVVFDSINIKIILLGGSDLNKFVFSDNLFKRIIRTR